MDDPALADGDILDAVRLVFQVSCLVSMLNMHNTIRHGFHQTDKIILERSKEEGWKNGATAVVRLAAFCVPHSHHQMALQIKVALVRDNTIYCGNLGDSELLIGTRVGTLENGEPEYEVILTAN